MRGIRISAIAIAAAALVLTAAAGVAAAGKKCPDGALCVWTGKNYKGTKYKVTEPGNIVNLPKKVNNKVSSAKNRWVNRAFLYKGKMGTGSAFCIADGNNVPDFADFFEPLNNVFSSAFLDESPLVCPP
jgi:hypothetical protein